jgi:hypothetical protein
MDAGDLTDRDKLLSCATRSQFQTETTVVTAPSRRRPDSIPTRSRTCGHGRASRSLRRRTCAESRPRRSAATWPPGASQPPTSSQAASPVSGGSGEFRSRTYSPPACGHTRPEHLIQNRRTSARVAERPASLAMTGFENSSMPWSLNVPVAEPPRTWPPSGPTRSRPWSAPCRHSKRITLPRRPALAEPLPPRRHHPMPPTQLGQPASQACCRWCRGEGRPRANSARRRRRRSSDGR